MGKNLGKGGKNHRRTKRGEGGSSNNRELIFKEDGQDYARIEKVLGSGRYNARSFPTSSNDAKGGVVRLAIRRGALRRLPIQPGDIVLLALRDWQDGKADIIHKYTPDETRRLHSLGELPLSALRESRDEENVGTARNDNDGDDVIFGHDSEDDDDDNQVRIDIDAI
ncbi:nucleic acid-binding protein [Xylaria acuta]|nr:nucleic acid-binding protein [Xylaria acuta]